MKRRWIKGFINRFGYPVFGGRAIRIDMLDRVISAVYDAAENGQFKAEHKMAEWLGSSIDGLYAVLSAMGHSKVSDPADAVKEEPKEDVVAADEVKAEDTPAAAEEPKTEEVAKPAADVKPELATFRLKKGKAFQKSGQNAAGAKKPYVKKDHKKSDAKPKGKRSKTQDRQPKVMSTGPEKKLEDSPFAILAQLQKNGNE